MNNKRIVIDPGHGGVDGGASGNGIREKDYTLLISKYMYDRFKELGIPVTLTRDDDITLTPTERVSRVLNAYGNDRDVIVVSNHLNAGGGDGAEVIYALRSDNKLPNMILDNLKLAGQNIRKSYQRTLPYDKSKDYYFMHRNTGDTESIIVEYGFVDSTGDDANQIKNNWQKYAEAAVKAIAEYAGYKYNMNTGDNVYVVKGGDTLYSIAQTNNTTINEIKNLNNLNSNILTIGQILILPNPTTNDLNDVYYIVKSGDTLYSIAKKNNVSIDDLKNINNLTSNVLSIGQKLLIPSESVSDDNNYYIVKNGDTLYSIARKYDTTIDNIKSVNNLISNILSIGQKLIIPAENIVNDMDDFYNVKSGDTLYSIARKFNTTIDILKKLNNLDNNLLSIGQILRIK